MTTKKLHPLLLLAATTLIAAPLLLASCTGTDDSVETSSTPTESQPIAFDAYLNRNTTRSGTAGALSTTELQTGTHASDGFGVFAYYTDDAPYSPSALPNFMYNQQVTWTDTPSDHWTYSPVKYWPNETGTDAQSFGIDRLSFFAYAPYTSVADPAIGYTADQTYGIVALTRASQNGYPYVRYYVSTDPSKCVDLCWADPAPNTSVDEKYIGTLNLTKPNLSTPVQFYFKHALAALNVQIDADIDDVRDDTSDHGTERDDNTRIYVRSITFTGFATKGELNLYNGAWNNIECDCDVTSDPITIHDGRWDGFEGVSESLNEKPIGLNPAIVQSVPYTTTTTQGNNLSSVKPGVTKDAVNLFNGDTADPIYVIPTNVPIRITIVYDVETLDDKLVTNFLGDGVTNGSSIQNTITADVNGTTGLKMEPGKQYTIKLHLGMTSVKVEANVADWGDSTTANVDLPNNTPTPTP